MGITKLENQNLNNDAIGSGEIDTGAVDSSKIGAEVKNEDISPSANITTSKLALPGPPSQFVRGDGSFGAIDTTGLDENAFNIGVLGFKMAVNEGLTIFNLVDGIVDEFNNESGVDTAENTNASYDSASDFYTNDTTTPSFKLNIVSPSLTAILKPNTPILNAFSSIPVVSIAPNEPSPRTNCDGGPGNANLLAGMFALGEISSFFTSAPILEVSTAPVSISPLPIASLFKF